MKQTKPKTAGQTRATTCGGRRPTMRTSSRRRRQTLPTSNRKSRAEGSRLEAAARWPWSFWVQLLATCILPTAGWAFILHRLAGSAPDDADAAVPTHESEVPSRAFPRWTEPPCIIDAPPRGAAATWNPLDDEIQREPTTAGILMVKIDKAGSTTLSGVAARSARALARSNEAAAALPESQRVCRCRISHAWSLKVERLSRYREKGRSFLFTMVRDPRSRAISEFFHFGVGMAGVEATDENFKLHLKRIHNFQLGLTVDGEKRERTKTLDTQRDANSMVREVLDNFDFVGVLERLDETLVLLQLILGLDANDVLYTSSKRHGSHIFVKSRANNYEGECKLIPPSFVASAVDEYFSGEGWNMHNIGDLALYDAANKSMDLTIQAIGRLEFEGALARFREAQALAKDMCEATLPCTSEGNVRPENERNCYWLDSGCNYPCLDKVAVT